MKKIFSVLLLFIFSNAIAQGDNGEKARKIEELVSKYFEYGYFNGNVLVEKNGARVFEKSFGFANYEWDVPNTPEAKFRIGSITKQFTATLILQLVAEGKLDLDGKLSDYLPDYRKDTGEKVTIRQLLNHTSGIPSYTDIPHVWQDSLRNHYSEDYFIRHFCSGDLTFAPGENFHYNNTGYYLLAVVLEKVTGKNFGELLKEKILNPAGMKETGIEGAEEIPLKKAASGYVKKGFRLYKDPYIYMPNALGAGDMYSTVEDLAKWDKALYGNKILPEKFKKLMFTPNKFGYGFGWFIPPKREGVKSQIVWHTGGINGFNTIIYRDLSDSTLIILFNNTGIAPLYQMATKIHAILHDKKIQYPRKPIKDYMYEAILDEGIDEAIADYENLKKEASDIFDFSENQLNDLGYFLLEENKKDEALKIFDLNVKEFPKSANVYDSRGKAFLAKGDTARAIEDYKKSLELNPANEKAIKILKKLNVKFNFPEWEPTEKDLQSYVGVYQLTPNFKIFIRKDGKQLFAKATGQGEFQIFPMTKDKFYYKIVNAQIKFTKNESGEITGLTLYQNGREFKAKKLSNK